MTHSKSQHRPRLAFLGVGWIGLNRMQSVAASGLAEIVAIADPAVELLEKATAIAPQARRMSSLDELLESQIDAVVIATPSALHAAQTIRVLESGKAVFCQKPLGRDAGEVRAAVEAARAADQLLGVDLSYRFTDAMKKIRALIRAGELGEVFAADFVFHNAYGPDKAWFYDRKLSGGGCVVDLGIHLVDMALWTLDSPVADVSSRTFANGKPLPPGAETVEDYALARLTLESGAVAQMVCSWRASAGRDAVIEAHFHGSKGGAAMHNVAGSFYDFTAERYRGTISEAISSPPDDWSSGAILDWVQRLAEGGQFAPEVESAIEVAEVLERITNEGASQFDPLARAL